MVTGLALGRGVLAEVILLLSGALDGATQQAAPHWEVDWRHSKAGDGTDDTTQVLEGVELVQSCRQTHHTHHTPS